MPVSDNCHLQATLWEGGQNLSEIPRQETSGRLRAIFSCLFAFVLFCFGKGYCTAVSC